MMSLVSLLLCGVMLFTGCVATPTPEVPEVKPDTPVVEKPIIEVKEVEELGFTDFDSSLISFIDSSKSSENYMVSPLSFKYALGMAIAGAGGETEKELLDVLGYTSIDDFTKLNTYMDGLESEFRLHNSYLNEIAEDYKKWGEEVTVDEIKFNIANSMWNLRGDKLSNDYVKEVKDKFDAEAFDTTNEKVVGELNTWVKEKTNNLIPKLLETAPQEVAAILVNTLYLKTSWVDEFNNYGELEFNAIDGSKVKKDFIKLSEKNAYYEDDNTKLVDVPMEGNIRVAFVLGDNSNIIEKLSKTKSEMVDIYLPKIEMETSFDKRELVDFLKSKGVKTAFDMGLADFDKMASDYFIGDIIQKTKLVMDEDGIEAAAATAIMMLDSAMLIEDKPKEFRADKPFTYYIYSDLDGEKELLFYGQYVK